jgi:hypothetical protein
MTINVKQSLSEGFGIVRIRVDELIAIGGSGDGWVRACGDGKCAEEQNEEKSALKHEPPA